MSIFKLFVALSAAYEAAAKLKIMSPESLAEQFKDHVIPAEYANFGYIPYGQTIMGRIHFQPTNSYGCDEFNMQNQVELKRTADVSPFYLAKRGGDCSFVQKVRNMENIGVAVGIVIDTEDLSSGSRIQMADDGTGGGIRIPSMLISKYDGAVLMNWIKEASHEDYVNIIVMAEFQMDNNEENEVDYELWMTSTSNRALDFIEDWAAFHESLLLEGDNVKFAPRYIFWSCDDCDKDYLDTECYGAGKYCSIDQNPAMTGREIIHEDLRQKCLFNLAMESEGGIQQWFSYIERVHATCYATVNEDCSRNAHSHLKLDYEETWKCVEDSFSAPQKDWHKQYVSNTMIETELQHWEEFGTNLYPSLIINKKTYRGQIEPVSVFNAICASFEKAPQSCDVTLGVTKPTQMQEPIVLKPDDFSVLEMVLMVIGVALLNAVALYCCRRRWRREMQTDMNTQIESQIGQYYALSTSTAAKSKEQAAQF